jgi:hypothetical protein
MICGPSSLSTKPAFDCISLSNSSNQDACDLPLIFDGLKFDSSVGSISFSITSNVIP